MALFTHDSRFMRFMDRLVDVVWLNLLWIAFSLPLVTIGASTVAAFSVTLGMVDEEGGVVWRRFLKGFRENFLQGTALWLLNAVLLYGLYIEWQFSLKSPDPPLWLLIACIVSSAFAFATFAYAYPQAARYRNGLGGILRNSFRISVQYPLRTLVLAFVLAAELFLFSRNFVMAIFGVLAGPMILVYTVSGVALPIFRDIDRESGHGIDRESDRDIDRESGKGNDAELGSGQKGTPQP